MVPLRRAGLSLSEGLLLRLLGQVRSHLLIGGHVHVLVPFTLDQ
jgi:hypothetical protein